ncbi:DUF961 family protein [Lapidilactobacillus mulanensis]|uniref:Uncharacterized protein n=2 Tax=Lapidilactobacillus TaxID=2767884 RepID=A0A0R1W305_9LACO|nr:MULTISPECIES: DUF961 family protein [Lapidilactobacillus]KRM09929.1 hypothetical protein FC15_GL001559 [Lapidilactobacillus concavus DSM 17758]GEL14045.1 hypothetical protein LCO01nite_15940 [Lapidilactobacillus concavus]
MDFDTVKFNVEKTLGKLTFRNATPALDQYDNQSERGRSIKILKYRCYELGSEVQAGATHVFISNRANKISDLNFDKPCELVNPTIQVRSLIDRYQSEDGDTCYKAKSLLIIIANDLKFTEES